MPKNLLAPPTLNQLKSVEDLAIAIQGIVRYLDQLRQQIERGTNQAYTPTNVTTDRAFDADTVLIAELADVVGTLIADLQSDGVIQ